MLLYACVIQTMSGLFAPAINLGVTEGHLQCLTLDATKAPDSGSAKSNDQLSFQGDLQIRAAPFEADEVNLMRKLLYIGVWVLSVVYIYNDEKVPILPWL